MKRTKQLLGAVSATALIALSTAPAMAADLGTDAGVDITNTVTVNYKVNGVGQTAEQDTDTLTVDRKVDVLVAANGGSSTVVEGQTDVAIAFDVTNKSNATIDLVLSNNFATASNFTNLTNVRYYVEDGTTAGFDASDTLVTHLEDMAEDETRVVYLVADMPSSGLSAGNGSIVNLIARAHDDGAANAPGAAITQTAGGNTTGVDTVFADADGPDTTVDGARDGYHSASNSYVVVGNGGVTVSKSSRVISDPVNGTTNPKAIPGAVVEYCIAVTNGGSLTATDIVISDNIPSEVEFLPNVFAIGAGSTGDIAVNGTESSGICSGGTAVDKSYTTSTTSVSNALDNLAASDVKSLYFRVTIK